MSLGRGSGQFYPVGVNSEAATALARCVSVARQRRCADGSSERILRNGPKAYLCPERILLGTYGAYASAKRFARDAGAAWVGLSRSLLDAGAAWMSRC